MAVLRRHPIVLFVTVLLMWLHLSQIMQHPHIIKLGGGGLSESDRICLPTNIYICAHNRKGFAMGFSI